MQKVIYFLVLLTVFVSCKTVKSTLEQKFQIRFLDEYIVPENIMVNETIVGGLSGIDYANGTYYLISDDATNPRYYEANIKIRSSKIDTISFTKVVRFTDSTQYLDVEAIRYDVNKKRALITSEGSINRKKDPSFFSTNSTGKDIQYFHIPETLKATSKQKPRNNGTLEGLTISHNTNGYWIAMELPLEADGPEPQVTETKSPVRITYIDANSQKPTKQFAYLLDKIDKTPKGSFAVNGLTDLIEYKQDQFIVIERSYSSGLGTQGNSIKLFNIDATNASNTLAMDTLKSNELMFAKKELLFNFESVRAQLTDMSIDNIEGLTFGPKLANGNKTLLLVADNNFNKLGPQLNQFILLEVVK